MTLILCFIFSRVDGKRVTELSRSVSSRSLLYCSVCNQNCNKFEEFLNSPTRAPIGQLLGSCRSMGFKVLLIHGGEKSVLGGYLSCSLFSLDCP